MYHKFGKFNSSVYASLSHKAGDYRQHVISGGGPITIYKLLGGFLMFRYSSFFTANRSKLRNAKHSKSSGFCHQYWGHLEHHHKLDHSAAPIAYKYYCRIGLFVEPCIFTQPQE